MDIQGQENQLILAFPDREVRCLDTADNRINRMLERSNISIIGNNNRVLLHFESEDSAEELLTEPDSCLSSKGMETKWTWGRSLYVVPPYWA